MLAGEPARGLGQSDLTGSFIEARSGPRMAYAFTSEIAAVLASAGPESPAGDYVSRTVPHLASPCLTEIANLAVDAATFANIPRLIAETPPPEL